MAMRTLVREVSHNMSFFMRGNDDLFDELFVKFWRKAHPEAANLIGDQACKKFSMKNHRRKHGVKPIIEEGRRRRRRR